MAFGAFASSGPDLSGAAPRRRSYIAIILLAPGVLYLVATFIAPLVSLVLTSFKEPGGDFEVGEYVYAFRWENYLEVFERFGEIFLRTFGYSIIATIIALVVSYPLAYFIGVILRPFPLWQSLVLILVIAPFFISFLLRTLAWKSIFADEGPVVSFLQTVGVLGPEDYLNGTAFTVVFGLTYNFIPFMTLPIYASLERLDLRYVEAG
ncbi:MAG TPA: ABC transporter permease, partial [Protaetiibacter sp.]|nr:ABC transporter permease [Protaetiibacter sp.]